MNNSSIHRFGKWIIVNKWELILLVLLVGNTSFLSNKISNIQAEIAVINSNINLLSELPLAYSETPKGLKLVHANQGVSKRDLEFLSRFRGPLLPDVNAASKNKPEELIKTIKAIILKGYAKEKKYLQEWGTGLSEREALIAYTVLRTNGSIPTYEVRTRLPNDLQQLVVGPNGNCSDYTIRLMMILECIGLKAIMISNVTNNLPGHVFVDAYDAHDDTSYLLDANFNVIIIRPNSNKQGFLEQLFSDSMDHDEFSRIARILVFPVYFRFIDPGETGFMGTPLTPEFLNEQRADREPMWRRWLAHDIEGLRLWWINTPSHAPKTLKELSMSYSAIPKEFNVSKNFAQKLRKVAGIGGF